MFNDDVTVGRKGFLSYLKALAGSNVIKVTPAVGDASESQVTDKGLRVVCGNHQGYIPNESWVSDNMPYTICQVRVSKHYTVMPNLGSGELAEALSRVLPFTAGADDRPVLQCVKLEIKDGKLTLVSADGFMLAIASLDFQGEAGEALIHRDDIKGLIPALRKAKRARLTIEQKPGNGNLLVRHVVIDTELVKYQLPCVDGEFPDYEKVIPQDFSSSASLDAREVIKASRSLLAFWYADNTKPLYQPLTLTVGNGKVVLEAKEERGKAEIEAETTGEGRIAVNGKYLIDTLQACGGIVNLQMGTATSPLLFSVADYQLVLMPMMLPGVKAGVVAEAEEIAKGKAEIKPKGKAKRKAKVEAEEVEPTEAELAEIEARKEEREAVAVA